MADAPVDSLRRLLLVPELDEYRTRFLAVVVVMDQQRAVQFEDIPRYCYGQLEALMEDAGAGDVEEGAAAVTSAGDAQDDVACEITEVVVPVAAAEDEIHENMACEVAVVAVPTMTLDDNIFEDTACETIPVASEDCTHQDTASKIPAPEDCNHEATACEAMVAIILTTDASESDPCENTVCEIAAGCHTHEGTACNAVVTVVPATTPEVNSDEDMTCKMIAAASENKIHEDTACEYAVAVIPLDNSIHEDTACEIISVAFEDCTHQYTTSKVPAPEDYNHEATVCEVTAAVDVAVASKCYTHSTTFGITVLAENCTHETRACELPAATT